MRTAAAPVPVSGFPGAINPGTVTVIPEPGQMLLLGIGLIGLALRRKVR